MLGTTQLTWANNTEWGLGLWQQCCCSSNLLGLITAVLLGTWFPTYFYDPSEPYEMLATVCSVTQHQDPEDFNPPQHLCGNVKSCIVWALLNINYTSHLLRNNWVIEWLMYSELEWIWREVFEASVKVLALYFPWGTEEDHNILNQYSATWTRFELVACWL